MKCLPWYLLCVRWPGWARGEGRARASGAPGAQRRHGSNGATARSSAHKDGQTGTGGKSDLLTTDTEKTLHKWFIFSLFDSGWESFLIYNHYYSYVCPGTARSAWERRTEGMFVLLYVDEHNIALCCQFSVISEFSTQTECCPCCKWYESDELWMFLCRVTEVFLDPEDLQ